MRKASDEQDRLAKCTDIDSWIGCGLDVKDDAVEYVDGFKPPHACKGVWKGRIVAGSAHE